MGTKAIYKDACLRSLQKLDLQENEQAGIEIMQRRRGAKSLRGVVKVDPELVDEIIADESWAIL
jgi:predicted DNA-binding antitoxin AbrB/MazE fold protein